MLSVRHIVKTFHGKKVLNDVSFDVQPGQIVVLLGQSGVGKSTVLRVLNNLEVLDDGYINLGNKPVNFFKIGMLFQDFNLFRHLTIKENITLPLIKVASKSEQEANIVADKLLNQFGLQAKADMYPIALSGGQKQRVALARTLAMNPEVLCLDEPTSALDPRLKSEIADIISQLAAQGYMIIITTHDIAMIEQLSCTIHLMQNGKIIETATTEEVKKGASSAENIKEFMMGK